jgi:Domain of unknown function (DUF4410)
LDRNENPAAIARLPGRGGGGRKGEAVELYGHGRGFHHRRTLGRLAADFERGFLPISLVNEAASESTIVFSRLFGVQVDRGVRERELVNLMATTLIEDLRARGITAYRFDRADQLPAGSWLLQGTFVQVDQGNRLERALIGFGRGATELDVVTSLSDLHDGHPLPFCEVDTIAHSRREAGAILSPNPLDAVGRFMLDGLDLDKNVMETGSKLAITIAHSVQSHDCALDS